MEQRTTVSRGSSAPQPPSPRDDFTTYAALTWPWLSRAAHLMTADPRAAEELARGTLAETYARRRRIPRGDADFHVRRTLVRRHLRRAGRRGADTGQCAPLLRALAGMPARQRVVLVLRHGEGLSDAETAQVLGCSSRAVTAHLRRGLAALEDMFPTGAGALVSHAERAHKAWVCEAFRAAVGDLGAPPPAQLSEVLREGRVRRRRRRTAMLVTCSVLLLVPSVAVASADLALPKGAGPSAADEPAPPESVRVVVAGERVRPLPGTEVWLTKSEATWSTPNGTQALEPDDGPALSLRTEIVHGRLLLTGVHRGERPAARVEVVTASGVTTGTLLTLSGDPGWMGWYATGRPPSDRRAWQRMRVTVYAPDGTVLARTGADG
ncbi:sigma factor-like helix-turn-helix DNA-binding protein [Streptomyces sp. NPDC006475]|uniref:sigma factor-like helix-turn-helix DNA-binding protein n=1 Tax=Streptomyces sp. NPDC006475 TaxID=3155719 RepID=UPI0033A08D34